MSLTTLGNIAAIVAACCATAAFVITVMQRKKKPSLDDIVDVAVAKKIGVPHHLVEELLERNLKSAKSTAKVLSYAKTYLLDRAVYLSKKPGDVDSVMLKRMARVCEAGSVHLTRLTELRPDAQELQELQNMSDRLEAEMKRE